MEFSTDRPFRLINEGGHSPIIIICDHASNRVPAAYDDLGLDRTAFAQHIAWDIGAAAITEMLAQRFDAAAVLAGASRLFIDCNRQLGDPSLIPSTSHGIEIPGNRNLSEAERERRWRGWHQAYHQAIRVVIQRKLADGRQPIVLAIHSMTPVLRGVARPWQIAVCWSEDSRLSAPMLDALRAHSGITVGDNEPYRLDAREDYSVPHHAMERGLRHLQIEFRQDEVADQAGQRRWADLFGDCLEQVLRGEM